MPRRDKLGGYRQVFELKRIRSSDFSITNKGTIDGVLMTYEMPVLDLHGWISGTGDGKSSPVSGDHDLG